MVSRRLPVRVLICLASLAAAATLVACSKKDAATQSGAPSASVAPPAPKPEELRPSEKLLAVGDDAPVFGSLVQTGAWISLRDFASRPTALLFAGNSTEWVPLLVAVRDGWLPLNERMSTLIALSPADSFQNRDLSSSKDLPMLLASDPDNRIHAAYGVHGEQGAVLVIVDTKGVIRRVSPNVTSGTVIPELRAGLEK